MVTFAVANGCTGGVWSVHASSAGAVTTVSGHGFTGCTATTALGTETGNAPSIVIEFGVMCTLTAAGSGYKYPPTVTVATANGCSGGKWVAAVSQGRVVAVKPMGVRVAALLGDPT